MEKKDIVSVQSEVLNLEKISQEISAPEAGAISIFSGVTRNHHQGKRVIKLEYEAYVPMAEAKMKKIIEEIRRKWKDIIHVALYHRIGEVPLQESSVIVIISSVHRRDGLEAVHYAIDEIKAVVPIWKREYYEDGSTWKENEEWRHKHKC
eukprot:TRINITY_DN11497_c0_g1_i3.p1 TRINITY_DN11497_c0_g1~~TRINITY_DN11497_c0_g1_i3.p1  ORF type:complete len:150 (-),score=14.20 TRINITY_DN11497_c0_g1_i3:116-565(-)